MTSNLDPVRQFHAHLNAGEADAVIALATEDVAVGGPRGSGEGRHLLREWVDRARITLQPVRWFACGELVVVEQEAAWHGPDGADTGRQRLATAFTVRDGRITRIARYGDIGEALTTSGLDEDDEVAAPAP